MPEGSRRGTSRSSGDAGSKRPSSGERGATASFVSADAVRSERERPASLSLSPCASSASLRDASRSSSSSSSSSSLPYGAVPAYDVSASAPGGDGSDISLDLTPLLGGGGGRAPGRPSRLERVVMEIVETEQAYVRDLKSIVEDYLGCIIDCDALPLNPEQVSGLFCNIEDIYEFNSELLEDLERSQHAAAIADCFVERSEAFDIYTLYCMNYPNSVSVLRECMKNPSLVRFFQERQATLNHSLPLETYLLKPVQRILKYHLLLQELAKHSDKSEAAYAAVEDAIITMTAVAWYINDMKRKQEHAVRLQEIQSLLVNWSGPDLNGFGELVLESSFKVHKVKKERAFFLFDKMLLIAKKRAERFVYSTHIFCCNLLLADNLKDPLCFRVSDLMIPKQQHVVQSKNMEEKKLWVHYLKKLIWENHPASLPHKARQVLGDNCCQSPQFEEEHPKTSSSASPLPDNIHAHHRGRRQSEPPELLTYTPEKSRKGFPLLLGGNLPYRRTRRRSAPAKDIRAAFHPHALKQADSEGELNSLSSAGSSGTLASIAQTESERERTEEEDEEEDLAALCVPPTLSITEEILDFINQSRAREGLVSTEQILDQLSDSQHPPDESNFTCPLPPVASSPEERLTPEPQQQEEVETRQDRATEEQTHACPNGPESATVVHESLGSRLYSEEESEGEVKREKTLATSTPPSPAAAISPSITVLDDSVGSGPLLPEKASDSSQNANDCLRASTNNKPKRGSALTGRDKRIIEKIRSYYEAAAELGEDHEAEEAGQVGDETSRRRTSFCQIPAGLVKDSVSHFTGDNPNESIETKTDHRVPIASPPGPASLVPPEASRDHDGHADTQTLISLLVLQDKDKSPPGTSPIPTRMEDGENPNQVLLNLPTTSIRSSEFEKDIENVRSKQSAEELDERPENSEPDENPQREGGHSAEGNDTRKNVPSAKANEAECKLKDSQEEKGRLEESSTTVSNAVQCQKTTPNWTRRKHEDVAKTSRNPEELSNRLRFGRGSRQSRIVSTNRALFEGTVSDITGIGLFEVTPATENSERILNKVQTLASMYSAKASSTKVPLRQKRASFVRNKAGDWTGLSLVSKQTRCNSQTKCAVEMIKEPKCDIPSHAAAKLSHSPADAKPEASLSSDAQTDTEKESQKSSHTEAQNNPFTQTRNKLHVPATAQMLYESHNATRTNRTKQNHAMSQEDKEILGERTDAQEKVVPGDEQKSTCELQTNGFTLSRPRDFIAALNKEQRRGGLDSEEKLQTEAMSPALLRTSSSSLTQDRSGTLGSELREHRVYTEDSASVNSTVHHSSLSSHMTHGNVSKDKDAHYPDKQDSPAVQDKHEPQNQITAKHHRYTSEARKAMDRLHSQHEYSVCTVPRHRDSSPGEMITLSSAKNLLSGQCQTLVARKIQQPVKECPKEAPRLVGGSHPVLAVSGGSRKEIKCDVSSYLPQMGKYLPDLKIPGPTFLRKPREGPSPVSSVQVLESHVPETRSPSVESPDHLPKLITQKTPDFQAMPSTWNVNQTTSSDHREPDHQSPGLLSSHPILVPLSGRCSPPPALLDVFSQAETSNSLMLPPGQETHLRTSPPVASHTSPSPVRISSSSSSSLNLTPSPFSVRTSTCSSPFRVIPLSSPTPSANEGFVSPDTIPRTPPCFPAPPSFVRSFSKRSPSASSPTASSAPSPSSFKRAGPAPSSPLRTPPCTSPVPSSSTFTRSLAASCISQTLSKKNNVRHQVQSSCTQGPLSAPSLPDSHLLRWSQSPRLRRSQEVSSTPACSHSESSTYANSCYAPSSVRSTCPSPASAHLTFRPNSPNPFSSSPTRPSHGQPLTHHHHHHHHHSLRHNVDSSQNCNSSNKERRPAVSNGSCSASPQKVLLANVSASCTTVPTSNNRLSFGSHNRIARPFSASEPNSRVPSPTSAVTPSPLPRLCSPPPQHDYASTMSNKPPQPRGPWTAGVNSRNPLGLSLEIADASSASLSFGPASSSMSPQMLSPPATGVSVWTCDVAGPQPRNPQFTSPSRSFSSCSSPTTQENASFSSPPFSPLASLSAGHLNKGQTLRRSHSNLSDTHPSPSPRPSGPGGPCCSWAESSHRSPGFTDASDQRGSGWVSPRSGWSPNDDSSSWLSPGGGLQSAVAPGRVAPRPDGQAVCNNFNGLDGLPAVTFPSLPNSQSLCSSMASEWGDPDPKQGSCRSQLICAYVGGPPPEPNLSSSRVLLSPPPVAPDLAPSRSSPAAFSCPSPGKASHRKTSYATTVNLQIAGSGRITSFSTAHVSVSQTPPGGPACVDLRAPRRVSINGLSHASSPLPQPCGKL